MILRLLSFSLLIGLTGCWAGSENEVVVYTALDAGFSEPIFDDFTRETGIQVLSRFDTESTKTVGLVQRIISEQKHPTCDLFWNNEILHTLRLEKMGLLETFVPPHAQAYPETSRSSNGTWHGFAARARVLLVNTDLVSPDDWPDSIHDLVDPRWKGQVGIAKPLFGTTATHAAVLFSRWGDERAERFFLQLHENARIESGNKQVALAVARGELAFGLTDTDDAVIEIEHGHPVAIIFPDQGEGESGTLLIPNTLCLIKGSPHGEAARELLNYLLTPDVESRLATGRSAQFPLNPKVEAISRAAPAEPVDWMTVDWPASAEAWDSAAQFLRKLFIASE